MPHIETPDGLHIRYEQAGEGPPLVLAHGFSVSLEMWTPQLNALSEGHRLILWDARGHGGSSAPADPAAYSMPALAADLRALLGQLDAATGAIVGGMSFGGQIALQYAIDHPQDVRALILSDVSTHGPDAGEAPAEVPAYFRNNPGLAGAYRAMMSRPDLTPDLPTLTMPVLVLYGQWDEGIASSIGRLADGLPNRRVVELAGCEHGTSAQRPQDWARVVLDFLADVAAGASIHGETRI